MASETTVNETETTVTDGDPDRQTPDGRSHDDRLVGWFASSTIRIGLAIVGFFLLLAALGQLSGINILGQTATLLGTDVGRWLLVAIVAIALIAIALYGFTDRTSRSD